MSPLELITLIGLTVYAVYKQTQVHEVINKKRFNLALMYAGFGLLAGGFYPPDSSLSWLLLVISILLSVIIGMIRAKYTKLWSEGGKTYSQGTVLTVALFIGLIVGKFILGTIEYLAHIDADGGFGMVLILISVMVAAQAELLHRRIRQMNQDEVSSKKEVVQRK